MEGERKLIVGAAVERPSGFVLACAAPLLEEEGHLLRAALTTDSDDPISKHGPRVRATLAADNHPVDSAQVEWAEVLQQGFDGEESNAGRSLLKRTDARNAVSPIFDAHTEGDVLKIRHPPQFTAEECSEPLVPLGEDLKNVPVSTSHDVADARDVVGWNVLMKQVAHRIDENLPWAWAAANAAADQVFRERAGGRNPVRTGVRAHRGNAPRKAPHSRICSQGSPSCSPGLDSMSHPSTQSPSDRSS